MAGKREMSKQGVAGAQDLSALEEARNAGLEVVQMLQKLPQIYKLNHTHPERSYWAFFRSIV